MLAVREAHDGESFIGWRLVVTCPFIDSIWGWAEST